jgi:hypothetical protein
MPKSERVYTEKVSVAVTPEQLERLKTYAEERGMTQTEALRALIECSDLFPVFPERLAKRLRWIAPAQRRKPRTLVENALRVAFSRLGWR